MSLRDLNKVWEIRALKKPGEEEAVKMLDKIAKQVQPIMRKRNWRVKLLSEFCPNNHSLLGLNVGGGVHVKLRLRRPNRDLDFFPFHQVLDTMLHELCHNAHGPHNANFYKLWDELRKECEELISKGITGTGEGFDLPGRRLGGFSRQPALSSLRKTALAAAEKRAKLGSVLPSQPKRLGGDCTIMVALSPIQAAAMAAERRLQDEIWCGSLLAEIDETSGDGETSSHIAENPVYMGGFTESSRLQNCRKRGWESNDRTTCLSSNGHSVSDSNLVDLSEDASTSGSMLDNGTNIRKKVCNSYKDPFSDTTTHIEAHTPEGSSLWACGTCTLLNPVSDQHYYINSIVLQLCLIGIYSDYF
ncbi:DNA-DEPENDENT METALLOPROTEASE WSS1 [Salix koriyanagi]|uniref:DNA-DEPENDENT METALLOPROTEASE WSS1 n=1 Tax=Salix koriyanagi TaxID=2511006 RepID=A0A9Q0UDR0_9ROSI|nr:DNA-DEPENDENT METALLOPROTEASE WSS1 [Salix koriyanagi]